MPFAHLLRDIGHPDFSQFFGLIAFIMKYIKTLAGYMVAFFALEGSFPDLANGMHLHIDLADGGNRTGHHGLMGLSEKANPPQGIRILGGQAVLSLNLHFWGGFGRAMIHPLYRKLYGLYYDPSISDGNRITLEWWPGPLKPLRPRANYPRANSQDIVIFTDTDTATVIMASVVFRKRDFDI